MKKLMLFLFFCSVIPSLSADKSWDDFIKEIEVQNGKALKDLDGFKYLKREDYFWGNRIRDGINTDLMELFQQNKLKKGKKSYLLTENHPSWEQLGPFASPSNHNGIGRISVIREHPNDPNTLFAGAAAGGLWKTTNLGESWEILQSTDFMSMGVADLAIYPKDPNIMYAAMGDPNVYFGARDQYSIGIIKSTDGGDTWNLTSLAYELSDSKLIGRVLVHPENPDIVITGTIDGVFRSNDGGENWVQTLDTRFVKDLEFKPDDHNVIYASTFDRTVSTGIYKSEDNGVTWRSVQGFPGAIRTEMSISKSDPNFIAAASSRGSGNDDNGNSIFGAFHSYAVSMDAGETWEIRETYDGNPDIFGNRRSGSTRHQGWYDMCIVVNPNDIDDVQLGGVRLWHSKDGTEFYDDSLLNNKYDDDFSIHVDHHFMVYSNDGERLYIGNDGGVWIVEPNDRDTLNKPSKRLVSQGMNITQIYKSDVSQQSDKMILGSQDNGTWVANSNTWNFEIGGDGMDNAINPEDENFVYGSSQYGNFRVSTNGGESWTRSINSGLLRNRYDSDEEGDWVAPIEIDPNNPEIIYAGFQNVWKNDNWGADSSWVNLTKFQNSGEFEFIEVAPSNSSTIYAGYIGYLLVSYNWGLTWEEIDLPNGAISNVMVDPNNDKRIFVTITGFNNGKKVYVYDGNNWQNISGNLPNVPVNCALYQPGTNDRIYVGTDLGVYFSNGLSGVWYEYGKDMPVVIITDMTIRESDNKIIAGSYSRGMWQIDLLECDFEQIYIEISGDEFATYCEGDSIEITIVDPKDGVQYEWLDGSEGTSIIVTENGSYSVKEANGSVCEPASKVIELEFYKSTDVKISAKDNKTVICPEDSIQLSVGFGFDEYLWDDGTSERRRFVYSAGDYTISTKNSDGCWSYDTLTIIDKPIIEQDEFTLVTNQGNSYKWYLDGELIEDVDTRDYSPDIEGNYSVEVEFDNCTLISEEFYFIPSSIFDDENALTIKPNPSGGLFTIELPGENEKFEVQIFNSQGIQLLSLDNVKSSSLEINLTDQINGVYFIKISRGSDTITKKIIIQK